jgi:phage-related minor tail protein
LEDEATRYKKVPDEINSQLTPYQELLAEKENDLRLMGLQGVARDIEIDRQRLGRDLTIEETAALREKNQALEDGARSAELQHVAQDALSDSIYDFVTGAKSAKDAAKGFFDSIAQYITRMIAENWAKKIGEMFSGSSANGGQGGGTNWFSAIAGLFGGGSANGNAFMGGQVQAFATGGVVNRTTAFGMSGGRFGIMGEAGPEAILPLHRGPDGKLGVRMAANDDGPRERVVNNHTTFVLPQTTTPQTQAQIAQNQQRAATRATGRNR